MFISTALNAQVIMGIRPRLSKNVLADFARFSIAGLVLLLSSAAIWNRGPVALGPLDKAYLGTIIKGQEAGATFDAEGVSLALEWIEDRTKPSINPLTIFRTHIKQRFQQEENYFAMTFQPKKERKNDKRFLMYFNDDVMYLKTEPVGFNRVLKTEFDPAELEAMLQKHIID